jgi:hypothetical protein
MTDARTRELKLALQRSAAADRLARSGMRAEALRLASSAHSSLAALFDPPRSSPPAMRELPTFESEVTDAHEQLLDDVLDATRALHEELARSPSTTRHRRLVAGGIGLALAAVLATAMIVDRRSVSVLASGSSSMDVAPDRAIDGDEKTDWSLPDHQTGWIEVAPIKPRSVTQIRILQAKNLPGADRGVKDFHLEIYADGKLATSLQGAFPSAGTRPQWRTFDVSVARVERVRVIVDSWFGPSGALSEIVLR